MQSLRIRSLESEVAHLLAENVSLRQQVINVTRETERLEAAKMLHTGVYEIKSRLDAKIAELNDLASELGMLPRKAGKLDKSDLDRPKAAGSRPQATDLDYAEDGRLPAILEDKSYPRKTLEYVSLSRAVCGSLLIYVEHKKSRISCRQTQAPSSPCWRSILHNSPSRWIVHHLVRETSKFCQEVNLVNARFLINVSHPRSRHAKRKRRQSRRPPKSEISLRRDETLLASTPFGQ